MNKKMSIFAILFILGIMTMCNRVETRKYDGFWKFKKYAHAMGGGELTLKVDEWKNFEVRIKGGRIEFDSCKNIPSCIDPDINRYKKLTKADDFLCKFHIKKPNNSWGWKNAFDYFKIGFKTNPSEITTEEIRNFEVIGTDCNVWIFREIVFINDHLMILPVGGVFLILEKEKNQDP